MAGADLLLAGVLFLFAAVVAVPLAARLGIGAVLGYLLAGIAIGPWGLGFISDVDEILHFSELGVVFLMFIIGLELNPSKLWRLRSSIFGVGAATVWVSYGVAQKVLLRRLASQQILFLLYTLCTISLLPLATPSQVLALSDWQLACLVFCGLNTLVGYGALAEAMARWQAAQVSALITLTPLFTLLFSDLLSLAWPDVFARPLLNLMGYLGAFVVVAGAMYSAVGHRLWGRWRKREAVVPLPRSGE